MKIASVAQLKAQLSAFLKASEGGPVVVTRKGRAVAVLIGVQDDEEIETMLAEHHSIYDFLLAGERQKAMAALDAHIRRSLEPNIDRLKRIGSMPEALRPPFLIQVGATRSVRAVRGSDY